MQTSLKYKYATPTPPHSHPNLLSSSLLHPPSRHNTLTRLALNLTPAIALIRRDQHHPLALLHRRLAVSTRIIRVQRLDMADLLGAAAGRDGGALLAACGAGGGVRAAGEGGGGG